MLVTFWVNVSINHRNIKRYKKLFDSIVDINNLQLAVQKARKGRTNTQSVKIFDENAEENLGKLQKALLEGTYVTSPYVTFKTYTPKERIIYKLPFYPDRIVHHALMNILEPIWAKQFIANTYSCIVGRGIHRCVNDIKKALLDKENTQYCLKLDIRKFYPSINHDVLKSIIRKKIGDPRLLNLLDNIVDSAEGLPIGNYPSQFFGNLYLSGLDHYIKEDLHVRYYFRYADDMVLFGANKEELWHYFKLISNYVSSLKLQLRSNYQVFPIDKRGLDFIGYVFYHSHTRLRKSIKKNLFKTISKYTYPESHLTSYFGWLKYCDSKNLLYTIENKTGLHYSNWNGKLIPFRKLVGKNIHVVHIQPHKKFSYAQVVYHGRSYEFRTSNKQLIRKMKLLTNLKIRGYERN